MQQRLLRAPVDYCGRYKRIGPSPTTKTLPSGKWTNSPGPLLALGVQSPRFGGEKCLGELPSPASDGYFPTLALPLILSGGAIVSSYTVTLEPITATLPAIASTHHLRYHAGGGS